MPEISNTNGHHDTQRVGSDASAIVEARAKPVAYVTFLEGNTDYVKGVIALARSLSMYSCSHPLVVGVAPTTTDETVSLIVREPNVVIRRIDWLELPPAIAESPIYANPQFVRNFTKLRLWELTEYAKLVYLDADTLAFANLDDMFLAPAFSAVLDNMSADEEFSADNFQVPCFTTKSSFDDGRRSYFNAGVMVFEPSADEFKQMLEKLWTRQPTRFAEQDFLNEWYRGRWNMLPTTYNWGKPNIYLCPELIGHSINVLKVVHFSGRLKPWHARSPTPADAKRLGAPTRECEALAAVENPLLRETLAHWWTAYDYKTSAVNELARKKVLFVVHRYYPYQGGSEYYVHWLASEAVERGWEVTVLADVHQGDQGKIRVTSDYYLLSAEHFHMIVVHGADCSTQDELLTRLACGSVASPVLYLLIKPSESETAYAGLQHARYLGWSTSLDLAHIHRHGQGAKAVHITHGVQPSAVGTPGVWRSRLGMPPRDSGSGGRLFVSAGGFGPHKRMAELAEAFGQARREDDQLILFGYQAPHQDPEGYFARCRAVPGVTVVFGGERQQVLDALSDADLYVMNSEWEGFGLVLLEAMLNGCEWAATAGAGAADDLSEYGITYTSQKGLISTLRHFKRNSDHAEKNRQICLHRFTVRTTVDQIEQVIHDEVSKGRGLRGMIVPLPKRMLRESAGVYFGQGKGELSASRISLSTSSTAPETSPNSAFVTLLCGRSDYVEGVLVLNKSLQYVRSQLPLIVAVTPEVMPADRERLVTAGCVVREVNPIVAPPPETTGTLARPEFQLCYSKFALWDWTEYSTLIYLDADAFVTQNIDGLANSLDSTTELAWVRDYGTAGAASEQQYFNAGVMVFKPSASTFRTLLLAMYRAGGTSGAFAEQDLLNRVLAHKTRELPLHFNCLVEYLGFPWVRKILEAEASDASSLMATAAPDADKQHEPTTLTLGDLLSVPEASKLPPVIHFTQPKPWRLKGHGLRDQREEPAKASEPAVRLWQACQLGMCDASEQAEA
mmetsp:Transcript_56249/g.99362  ORF Transcript_56249/g.99362 Transcript_56249/m.99362 type:complete len:1015 (+) Transcript_56249:274-3318(+)